MSFNQCINGVGSNRGLINASYLPISVAGEIVKTIVDGGIVLTGTGSGGNETLAQTLALGNDANNLAIQNALSVAVNGNLIFNNNASLTSHSTYQVIAETAVGTTFEFCDNQFSSDSTLGFSVNTSSINLGNGIITLLDGGNVPEPSIIFSKNNTLIGGVYIYNSVNASVLGASFFGFDPAGFFVSLFNEGVDIVSNELFSLDVTENNYNLLVRNGSMNVDASDNIDLVGETIILSASDSLAINADTAIVGTLFATGQCVLGPNVNNDISIDVTGIEIQSQGAVTLASSANQVNINSLGTTIASPGYPIIFNATGSTITTTGSLSHTGSLSQTGGTVSFNTTNNTITLNSGTANTSISANQVNLTGNIQMNTSNGNFFCTGGTGTIAFSSSVFDFSGGNINFNVAVVNGSIDLITNANDITLSCGGGINCNGNVAINTVAGGGSIDATCTIDSTIVKMNNLPASGSGTALSIFGGQIYITTSSRRFKKNIEPLLVDTSKIYDMKLYKYQYLNDHDSWGYIAEELYDTFPMLVTREMCKETNEMLPYSVKYAQISCLIIEEMKNLNQRIKELENQI